MARKTKKAGSNGPTPTLPNTTLILVAINKADRKVLKRVRKPYRVNANRIVDRIIREVKDLIVANGKQVTSAAFAEWRPKLFKSVHTNLLLGAPWNSTTQTNVLSVAADMGTIAVLLAGANPNVAKSQIHASFNAVQQAHTVCAGGIGGGSWCDFAM